MDITVTLLVAIATLAIGVIIRWSFNRHSSHQLFKRHGIPGPEPSFFTGNMLQLQEGGATNVITSWLKQYGNVFGYYMGGVPYLVINDLEMQKQVFIKDFQFFSNRPDMFIDVYPLNTTLMSIKDKHWKDVRSILSPTFSSGKIKLMSNIMNKKIDITVELVDERAKDNQMFDIYELMQCLTLDVIADCALAMKTRCQDNPKERLLMAAKEFIHLQNTVTQQSGVVFPFVDILTKLASKYGSLGKMADIVLGSLKHAIETRKKNPAARSRDLLQLMLDSREEDSAESAPRLSDEEVAHNAYLFLLAGFETTSTALAFTFHLLVSNPEIQDRLYAEIEEAEDASYSTIQKLQYLDQTLNESLRIYPPVTLFVTRHCDEDRQVGSFTIPKGSEVLSPVWDIHHDPDLWPDPYKFDPDRWSPENKAEIKNLSFQAFGAGPRNCIGARFALLEAKLAIFRLLKKFRFETCEKTENPMRVKNLTFNIQPENGVWLRAIRRH